MTTILEEKNEGKYSKNKKVGSVPRMANATVGAGAAASAAFELVLPGGAGLRGEWIAALCVCWGHSGLGSRLPRAAGGWKGGRRRTAGANATRSGRGRGGAWGEAGR